MKIRKPFHRQGEKKERCYLHSSTALLHRLTADLTFPRALLIHRGGLIFWADLVGAAKIEAKLSALAQMVSAHSLLTI